MEPVSSPHRFGDRSLYSWNSCRARTAAWMYYLRSTPGSGRAVKLLHFMSEVTPGPRPFLDMQAWATLFARVMLGLIFGMAGYWKCFVLTLPGHVHRFILPYADTWIPVWLLWAVGLVIPVVELVAGWLLVLGLRVRESLIA